MSEKRIDCKLLPDGTYLVTTPDEGQPHFAEARARQHTELHAVHERFRAGGCPRPVTFVLQGTSINAHAIWLKILPELRRVGVPSFTVFDADADYTVKPDDARRILEPLVGKCIRRDFRRPHWPTSFWTAVLTDDDLFALHESRTPADMRACGDEWPGAQK